MHYAEYNTDTEINLFVFPNPLKKIPNVLICLETTEYFTFPSNNVSGSTLIEKLGWTMDEKKKSNRVYNKRIFLTWIKQDFDKQLSFLTHHLKIPEQPQY